MHNDGDTAATNLAFTDALQGGRCLTCANYAAPFWNNAAAVADDTNINNVKDLKSAVAPLAATYPSYYRPRPSCPKLAVGGMVSGLMVGGTFGGAIAISAGVGRRGILGSAARNAVGFGLWTGTFRGTKCAFARSGIPGSDGMLGATAAGAVTGAFLTVALSGFNMNIARPAIVNNAAGSAFAAAVFSLLEGF